MKLQSKPIVALASGAILLLGVLCQSAQAQSTVTNESASAILAANNGVPADALTVNYMVLFTSGGGPSFYTYDYTVVDPGPGYVEGFNVAFNAELTGTDGAAVIPGTITGMDVGDFGEPSVNGVSWFVGINPGTSDTLSFESPYGPTSSTANASGAFNPPSGWATTPGGQLVPVPNVTTIPEPATTTLLALALLVLAFRPNLLKKA
jgi:hypothetical protein